MSNNSERLCQALLPYALDSAVVDLLLIGAPSGRDDLTAPKVPPSTQVSRRYLKKDLNKAQLVASITDEPDLLAAYAKDPRKTVRRLVAANPHTPKPAREYLLNWGLAQDPDTVSTVVRYLPERALDLIETDNRWSHAQDYFFTNTAKAVLDTNDRVLLERAWRTGQRLRVSLVIEVYAQKPAGLDLTTALSFPEVAPEELQRLLERVIYSIDNVTVELVELCQTYSMKTPLRHNVIFTPGAVEATLHRPSQTTLVGLANTTTQPKVYSRLLDQHSEPVNMTLARRANPRSDDKSRWLPVPISLRLGRELLEHGPHDSNTLGHYFEAGPERVNLDVVVGLLRQTDHPLATRWLMGELKIHPLPGQVAELFADPGTAFSDSYGETKLPHDTSQLSGFLSREWADEVVQGIGGEFFSGLSRCNPYHSAVYNYLYERVNRAFGPEPKAWETFLRLASEWNQSLNDLFEAISTMSNIPLLDAKVEPEEPEPAEPVPPQGLLFASD